MGDSVWRKDKQALHVRQGTSNDDECCLSMELYKSKRSVSISSLICLSFQNAHIQMMNITAPSVLVM